jgi:MoaA/NifB/PqqE/SkfB family radical SAM enzyme
MERFLSIHVTDLCNSQCSFCVVGSPLQAKETVEYSSIVRFLEENAHHGWNAVNLHGGEPTIHPRFLQLLELIRTLGYPEVHIQTNAIKLSDPGFVAKIMDLGVTKFIISLHGDLPEFHDSQTGTRGGFVRTIQGIRNVKARAAHVRTNTVITRQNLARLPNICRLACDIGVDHINISNMHPVGSALYSRSASMASLVEIREPLYRAVDLVAGLGPTITLEGFPFCAVKERSQYRLNNEPRDIRMLIRGDVVNDYDQFMSDVMRVFGPPCTTCAVKQQCGGVYPQYVQFYNWTELAAVHESLPQTLEPAHA